MRHPKEVAPYNHTYYARNKHTGERSGEFDCLIEAVNFAKAQPRRHRLQDAISYTFKLEATQKYERDGYVYDYHTGKRWWETRRRVVYETHFYPPADWVITNDLGELVTKEEVNALNERRYRDWRRWDEWYELHGRRMTRVKGASDKVKLSCEKVKSYFRDGDVYYSDRCSGNYRGIQTTNERRQNEAHTDEYGEWIVRGRRRVLPTCYDDHRVSIHEASRSWKHHSKRRKQWKAK